MLIDAYFWFHDDRGFAGNPSTWVQGRFLHGKYDDPFK